MHTSLHTFSQAWIINLIRHLNTHMHTQTHMQTHAYSLSSLREPQQRPVDKSVPVGYYWAITMVTSVMSRVAGHLEICHFFLFFIIPSRIGEG